MIQKMFEKYLLNTFNKFNAEVSTYFIQNTEILKKHNEELLIIKKALERPNASVFGNATAVIGSYSTTEETIRLLDQTLGKDYFTKEFINNNALNTKELLVIENNTIKLVKYKEGNGTKDIKTINSKDYLFL